MGGPWWMRLILRLYPRDFRRTHGSEVEAFVQRERQSDGGAPIVRWRRDVRMAADLVIAAVRARRRGPASAERVVRRAPSEVVMNGLDSGARDLRLAARSLGRAPLFSVLVVATLGVGIGLSASIFSTLNAVLFRPLPYANAEQLVHIGANHTGVEDVSLAGGTLEKIRQRNRTFSDVAGVATIRQNLTGTELPRQVDVGWSTPNFFELLGVHAAIGRVYGAGDPMGTAVLSDASWRRDFGGDPSVIGDNFRLDGSVYTVVGVLPPEFEPHLTRIPRRIDVWKVPDTWWQNGNIWDVDGVEFGLLRGVGRLRPGADLSAARADADRLAAGLRDEVPSYASAEFSLMVEPLRGYVVSRARPVLLLLMGAVAAVLLIVCANVTGLLLVRAEDRHHDVAVRLALGSGNGRVIRHLLSESLVLAVAGGLLGLAVAAFGMRALARLAPSDVPRLADASLDPAVAGFALITTLACTVLFGLAPAARLWRRQPRLVAGGLRTTAGRGAGRTRGALVIAQIAASLVLLVCAGLLASSMNRLGDVQPGFDSRDVLTFSVSLPGTTYDRPTGADRFYRTLAERIEGMPGVSDVAVVWPLPLAGRRWDDIVVGGTIREASLYTARYEMITPSYFETMRIPVVAGQLFGTGDPKRTVMVSRSLAERAWPGQDPVGLTLRADPWGPDTVHFVVTGVVEDVRYVSLRDAPTDVVYFDSRGYVWTDWEVNFVVRSSGDLPALGESVREILASMDPDIPLADVRTMASFLDSETAATGFARAMFVLFAVVAAFLALLGLYGIVAYDVRMRRREFGIRMALGSSPHTIVALALRHGLILTAAGITAGLVLALWAGGLLRGFLFGVATTDARILAAVATGLAAIALLSALLPARRAARLDPARVLRSDA